ncbi:MAG: hypothetical protein H7X97_05255 [Opitutaceae bacterium]|nr:hypothetical protein [Verrucomicrobiales bacterium]
MKHSSVPLAIICSLVVGVTSVVPAADIPSQTKLDVLKMQEIPTGLYDVQLQLAGENHTVKLAIKDNRLAFAKSDSAKLEGLSGKLEFIGNGVFMVQLAGKNHRATQWWIFHPDGTASVKEIPDRGEKQTVRPASEK